MSSILARFCWHYLLIASFSKLRVQRFGFKVWDWGLGCRVKVSPHKKLNTGKKAHTYHESSNMH